MDTKNTKKTFLVEDSGLYSELGNGLGKHGDKVLYHTPFHASFFPKYEDFAIGKGFEHIEKIKYLFDYVEKADCICNFDVGGNDLIAFLRRTFPDKPIFGSGKGEKLENSRSGLKKVLKSAGIASAPYVEIKGITALKDYLKKNKDKYVKVDIFRGTINSFPAIDYKSCEQLLLDWEHELGLFSEEFSFVVEDAIHSAQEWGVDTFYTGNDYIKPYIYGVELDKDSYIGCVSEALPPQLQDTMNKLKPVLKELDWRGCISTEEKIVSKTEHYFLDICARAPNPLGLLYPEYIDNWPEMVYNIAAKKPTRLQCKYKYLGCVPLTSEHVLHNWVKVNFPAELRPHIKFMTASKKGDEFFATKGSPESVVCVAVAGDNTISGVSNKLKNIVDKVSCYEMDKYALSGLDKITKIVDDGKKLGILF